MPFNLLLRLRIRVGEQEKGGMFDTTRNQRNLREENWLLAAQFIETAVTRDLA